MFICQKCGRRTEAKERAYKVVVEQRKKIYEHKVVSHIKKQKVEKIVATEGWEVAREIQVCSRCKDSE